MPQPDPSQILFVRCAGKKVCTGRCTDVKYIHVEFACTDKCPKISSKSICLFMISVMNIILYWDLSQVNTLF